MGLKDLYWISGHARCVFELISEIFHNCKIVQWCTHGDGSQQQQNSQMKGAHRAREHAISISTRKVLSHFADQARVRDRPAVGIKTGGVSDVSEQCGCLAQQRQTSHSIKYR
jgi:hypothetical protein